VLRKSKCSTGRYAAEVIITYSWEASARSFSTLDKGIFFVGRRGQGFADAAEWQVQLSGFGAWLLGPRVFLHIQFLATSSLRLTVFLQWICDLRHWDKAGDQLIVHHQRHRRGRRKRPATQGVLGASEWEQGNLVGIENPKCEGSCFMGKTSKADQTGRS